MKLHLKTVGNTDTWITPKYITDALGEFDLDPCAHTDMPWQHAKKQYTIEDDGLSQEWEGRVWLNPPFNRYQISQWMAKMAEHKNGIMFLSAALETERFRKYVWGKAVGICFMNHRPVFRLPNGEKPKNNSGQTVCLIAYDDYNMESLINSKLGVTISAKVITKLAMKL